MKRYFKMLWTGLFLVIAGWSMSMLKSSVTTEQRERFGNALAKWRAEFGK